MKIALAQLNYHTGNFEANTFKIISAIQQAKAAKVDLVVFGELAVCGYPPRDFLEFEHFIKLCYASIDEIKKACTHIACVIGAPYINPKKEGKDLLNASYFIHEGEVKKVVAKQLLPTYDVFDEYRYFEIGTETEIVELNGTKIALTICEDMWNLGRFELYPVTPLDQLYWKEPQLIINVSASPFSYMQQHNRLEMLQLNASRYHLPTVYVNHVGAQTDLIFDGDSMAINPDGSVAARLASFEEAFDIVELDEKSGYFKPHPLGKAVSKTNVAPGPFNPDYGEIYDALIMGIKDYFDKLGFKKATLGLSGGVDSALVTALAAAALGPQNVHVLLMPSKYSSDHSINDSIQLVNNLAIGHNVISIEKGFDAMIDTLNPYFTGLPENVAEENIQSRLRMVLLMAFTNKFGYILLNTSNKSELAVGYGTMYGDMAGGIGVIGDLYKTQIYGLCEYINREKEIIPVNILTKAPSAELRPNQKDSDSLPDYDILDEILYQYIEQRKGPREIIELGYDEALVKRILKMVNINEYKRHQAPPILRVSPKAFGMGRRLPIVAKYLS